MTPSRMSRHLLAVVRLMALFGLALAVALAFAVHLAVFVPGFGLGLIFLLPGPILAGRRLTNLARRLAGRWSGVQISEPYRPRPADPVPEPDGLYLHHRQLYRTPRMPAFAARLDWVLGDTATWRDLRWMLLEPIIGGALAAAPAALIGAGAAYAVGYGATRWWAVPLGVLTIVAGVAVAPALLWLHARWTWLLLRPVASSPAAVRRKKWIGDWLLVLVRLFALLGLTLLGALVAALTSLTFVLAVVYGQVPFPPVTDRVRRLVNLRRRLAGRWSGAEVAIPYLPRPDLLARRPDGLYQVGRHLYKTSWGAAYAQRLIWMRRDPATWRDLGWQLADPVVGGLLLLLPLTAIGYGIWGLTLPRLLMVVGLKPDAGAAWYAAVAGSAVAAIPVGLVLAALGVLAAPAALRWHGRWTRLLLAPTARSQLALRVQRLTETRADALEVQAAELRRIERDLHDGAQARLVAVGLTLGTIEHLLDRDPAAARALLAEARESSAKALGELRDLVRGIHPPVLAERGLGDAIRALALDIPLPTEVRVDLPGRLPSPVESAAYFAVTEVLTNVVKHAQATRALIEVRFVDDKLRIIVQDDGRGGADPARGSGLRGLQRRLGTFDGTVEVSSPPGGPTVVTLEVPCVWSWLKTSTS